MLNTKIFCNINPKNNFNNFIEGKSNIIAKTAAINIINNFGNTYNPFFIYGDTGLGKTHLLHAVFNRIIKNKSIKIIYINSEEFTQDMIKALKTRNIQQFQQYYRSFNVLIIDDIQFFSNKFRSQEELIYTFNSLIDRNQQVILSSNKYPKKIIGIQEKLISLIELGLIVKIEPPELKTRISILTKKAIERDLYLSKEIIFFIAYHLNSNIRELQGALNYIIANANLTGRKITISLVKELLSKILEPKKHINIRNIQKTVAEYYGISLYQLISRLRLRSIALPRQIAMYLSKKLTSSSLVEIGREFGKRDHTTVLHAYRKIQDLHKKDIKMKIDYFKIIERLTVQT